MKKISITCDCCGEDCGRRFYFEDSSKRKQNNHYAIGCRIPDQVRQYCGRCTNVLRQSAEETVYHFRKQLAELKKEKANGTIT